jgi:quinol monooxygenase YgiN
MPLYASTRALIAAARRSLGVALSVLLAALVWFGWGAAPLAAATVPGEGPEVRVVGRLPLQLTAAEQRDFEQKTLELAAITRRQDHVTSYSCNGDIEHPGVYVFDEIWPSEAALQAHLETPHFKAWWSWVEPHLAGDLVIGVSPTDAFHVLEA